MLSASTISQQLVLANRLHLWLHANRTLMIALQRLVLASQGSKQQKLQLLLDSCDFEPSERTIIFVQKKHVATWVRVGFVSTLDWLHIGL